MGGAVRPGPSRRAFLWLLTVTRLHRHRVEPDLSALIAFPSCRCGTLLWPSPAGSPEQVTGTDTTPEGTAPRRRFSWRT